MQGLKHQSGRARRADVDRSRSRGTYSSGAKVSSRAPTARAGDLRLPDHGGGLDGLQMLGAQSGLGPVGPDLLHAKRAAGQERERQRGAEDLAPALAARPVQLDLIAISLATVTSNAPWQLPCGMSRPITSLIEGSIDLEREQMPAAGLLRRSGFAGSGGRRFVVGWAAALARAASGVAGLRIRSQPGRGSIVSTPGSGASRGSAWLGLRGR